MTIDRRRFVLSSLSASLVLPGMSLAQTDDVSVETTTDPADDTMIWEENPDHALVHERLRSFLGSVIGKEKDTRLELASAFLSNVDPSDPSYVLAESAAYGVLVRGNPIRKALSEGYHRSSKEGLLFAISQYPDSPWTAMMNSAWHFEVIRRSTIGASVMGASGSKGQEFLDEALTDEPGDPGLYLAAAISLLSEKPKTRAEQASAHLDLGIAKLRILDGDEVTTALAPEYLETVGEHLLAVQEIMTKDEPKAARDYVLEIF